MISTAAQRTTSPSPVLWHPKPAQTLPEQTDNNDTATVSQPSSEATVSSGMPSTEALLASNNVKIKRTTISTAPNYQSWSLEIEGNQLFLQIKGQARKVVKTGNLEELQAIKQLFKPENVQSYEMRQGTNGNCSVLAALQAMMLTCQHLEDLIKAVGYDSKKKSWSMTYYDENDNPKVYSLSKEEFSLKRPPNDNTVASSSTHQDLNALVDGTFRQCVFDNLKKGKTPDDPKNLNGVDPSLLATYLNKTVKKNIKDLHINKGTFISSFDVEPFTLKQLAQLRRENPDVIMTVSIDTEKKDAKGNWMREPSGEWAQDTMLEQELKKKKLFRRHVYTVLDINEEQGTVTVVNPHNSSEAIVLDSTTLFFTRVTLANNATDENSIATAPAPVSEETA